MIQGVGVDPEAARFVGPGDVNGTGEQVGPQALADELRHKTEVGQLDLGPPAPVQLGIARRLTVDVEHVDLDLVVLDDLRQVRVIQSTAFPPEPGRTDAVVEEAVEGDRRPQAAEQGGRPAGGRLERLQGGAAVHLQIGDGVDQLVGIELNGLDSPRSGCRGGGCGASARVEIARQQRRFRRGVAEGRANPPRIHIGRPEQNLGLGRTAFAQPGFAPPHQATRQAAAAQLRFDRQLDQPTALAVEPCGHAASHFGPVLQAT